MRIDGVTNVMSNLNESIQPRILRLPQVQERVPLSRSRIYALEKMGDFPSRRKLGGRAVGWFEHEIDAWLLSRDNA